MEDPKPYDLEERTFNFARDVREFVKGLKPTIANIEDGKQFVRASGSVGANYIEANESLGKKDFLMRARICKKESKESRYWLRVIDACGDQNLEARRAELIQEAQELMNILGSIIRKSE